MKPRPNNRVGFLRSATIDWSVVPSRESFPFNIPAVQNFGEIEFHPAVTFLIGENGSGKSTIIESIAIRLSFEEIGGAAVISGNRNLFDLRARDGGLHDALRLRSNSSRVPADRFFMRAETVFDLANKYDALEREYPRGYPRSGGKSLHARSHGEAFLAIVRHRMVEESLIIMDEPEAALSPTRQLTLIKEIDWLVRSGCQLLIATHSPILMAYPDSQIFHLDETGIHPVEYQETEHYDLTKRFLNHPEAYLRHLVE
jgi:predicted ATPase